MREDKNVSGIISKKCKGYGFIKTNEGDDVFFLYKILTEKVALNQPVKLDFIENEKGLIATYITSNSNETSENKYIPSGIDRSAEALSNISKNWKLEAKLEDNQYFYNIDEVQKIKDGEKLFIIGRKGSGKSAICEHIVNQAEFDIFTKKLSFKNFPFNDLYHLENIQSYTEPNQYITLWKYLIYSTICQLMASNENIDSTIRVELEKIYPRNSIESLSRTISKWTSAEFGANILGQGGTIKIGRDITANYTSWIERVNVLEDIINTYCDSSKYFIVFDELDEDYREIKEGGSHNKYTFLLTSLFKAVQDIKANISVDTVYPIIFLRDDIYSLIKDSDKNKWRDYKIDIEWTKSNLKNMLAFRINKDITEDKGRLSFSQAWDYIFSQEMIGIGTRAKKKINSFEFITNSTQLRPRDYIRFIQVCAEESVGKKANKIFSNTIKFADRAFSNYLRDEIVDEIHPVLPDIDIILQIITNIRKWNFTVEEFKDEYQRYIDNGTVRETNIDFVLNTLFNFSVIGNQHKKQTDIIYFKYMQTNMNFNKKENIIIHRGLLKSLQII